MKLLGMGRWHTSALAAAIWLLCAGCATMQTLPKQVSAEAVEATTLKRTETLLTMAREVGWKEVQDLLPVLDDPADGNFPGVAALARDVRSITSAARAGHGAPPFDIEKFLDRNPDFWDAYYEISPGDPLVVMLHVSLLLAAGEAARADRVATLAISFGRMDLEYRKELVRLDTHAQLVLHVSRGNALELERLRGAKNYAALAAKAQAALAVWPENPAAWLDLAVAQQAQAGSKVGGTGVSPVDRSLAALRRADPLYAVTAPFASSEPSALTRARRLWTLIDNAQATGDDQVLEQFAQSAQAAGLDELALTAHGLLAGWHGGSMPLDESFVHASLQRLVSADEAALICRRVFSGDHQWLGLGADGDASAPNFDGVLVHPQLAQQLLVQIAATSYWIESGLAQGADLAENYGERGEAWAQLLQKDEAVTDLRRSLELEPQNNTIRYNLAVALSDAGNFHEADAVFAEARRRAPSNALEMQAWGNHLLKQGRFAEAEAAYTKAAKLDPSFAYARIMRHLARVRQGKPGDTRIDPKLEKGDPWGASLVRFLAGRMDEKALFGRLESKGGLRYSEEECELYFVLAQLALSRGDIAEARRDLHSCLSTGITSFVEYAMAWHELRRLNVANPLPAEKKSNGGAMADQEPV